MTTFYLFEIGYAIIAFACGYYTFAEGENNRSRWDLSRLFGLAACVFWPLLPAVVMLASRVTKNLRPQ